MSFVRKAPFSASATKEFSSGIPSFEKILLGIDNIPAGNVIALHQDWPKSSSNYTNTLIKCLISSSLYSSRPVTIIDTGEIDRNFLESCPMRIQEQEQKLPNSEEKLRIAHRYRHLQLEENAFSNGPKIQEHFDLSSPIPKELLKSANINFVKIGEIDSDFKLAQNSLLIIIDFLSPNWPQIYNFDLILRLKSVVKKSNSIFIVSTPSYCVDDKSINSLNLLSDCVVSLSSLSSSPLGLQAEFKDYDGFARLLKPFRVTFRTALPSTLSIAFKCKSSRRFIFEPFHLPPDLTDIASRQITSTPNSACSSGKIDF
jgi:hypothetical protein